MLTAGRQAIRLPNAVNLSHEHLCSEGLFLLENGVHLWLWVGRRADPAKLSALFGVSSIEGIDPNTLQLRLEVHATPSLSSSLCWMHNSPCL